MSIVPEAFASNELVGQRELIAKPAPPPGLILCGRPLKKQAPISQEPNAVFDSQPVFKRAAPVRMLGDMVWPPKPAGEGGSQGSREADGPNRRQAKDYRGFFSQHQLPPNFPTYRAPPGTQHFGLEEGENETPMWTFFFRKKKRTEKMCPKIKSIIAKGCTIVRSLCLMCDRVKMSYYFLFPIRHIFFFVSYIPRFCDIKLNVFFFSFDTLSDSRNLHRLTPPLSTPLPWIREKLWYFLQHGFWFSLFVRKSSFFWIWLQTLLLLLLPGNSLVSTKI